VLIEINLAPGASAAKVGAKRLASLKLPSLPSIGGDLRAVAGGAAALLVLGLASFGYLQLGSQQASLETRIQQEVTDSVRLATTIALMRSLQAREDTILRKIEVIRSVDTRRYVWPRLLDEISFAVPAYTWISAISSTDTGEEAGLAIHIQGNAGSTQALTRFMKNLEGSPFIRRVSLVTSEQDVVDGRTIQRFSLEAEYLTPDPSVVRTTTLLALD
jgi:Tfp pilus assembly protein PilN